MMGLCRHREDLHRVEDDADPDRQSPGAPAPPHWLEDARAALVLFTSALDLLGLAGPAADRSPERPEQARALSSGDD